ncbi:hypothetical protein BKA70DRAFT_1223141 [Coprinopsis sp. MPI-PUGE-AT-0042]|nr:hypothetical protein BKA70DRAFT_1223141 [Coprinopsis sp. MPI-PUGE-AT-0042]
MFRARCKDPSRGARAAFKEVFGVKGAELDIDRLTFSCLWINTYNFEMRQSGRGASRSELGMVAGDGAKINGTGWHLCISLNIPPTRDIHAKTKVEGHKYKARRMARTNVTLPVDTSRLDLEDRYQGRSDWTGLSDEEGGKEVLAKIAISWEA